MNSSHGYVQKFASRDLKSWMADERQRILFGDVFEESEAAKLDITFIRWSKGESGPFDDPLPYDVSIR